MNKVIVLEWIESFLEATVLAVVLFFLFWPVKIDGSSMENTFFSGDRVIISRVMAYSGMIENGDIIICRLKNEDNPVIKRIIASEGDKLEIYDNKVKVNGIELDEPYIKNNKTSGIIKITLGENEFFVLGDNREVSYDSRRAGIVKKKDIIGKVIFKWYPFKKIKVL